jgi:hypothetical protein
VVFRDVVYSARSWPLDDVETGSTQPAVADVISVVPRLDQTHNVDFVVTDELEYAIEFSRQRTYV